MVDPLRNNVRRAVDAPCIATAASDFQLVANRVRDVSTQGLLVETCAPVAAGQEVVVIFRAPGEDRRWIQARTRVTRLVLGTRAGDQGPAAALAFTEVDAADLAELGQRLVGIPPTIPRRAVRVATRRHLIAAA